MYQATVLFVCFRELRWVSDVVVCWLCWNKKAVHLKKACPSQRSNYMKTQKTEKSSNFEIFSFTFKTSIVDSFKRTSSIYPLHQPSCKSTLFNQNKMPTVSKKPSIIFFTVLWEIYQRNTFLRFSVFYIKKQGLREYLYLVQNNVSSQVCTFNSFLIIQKFENTI